MPTLRRALCVLCLVSATFVSSCENQTINVYDMMSPQVIEVSDDGTLAKVNIGMYDGTRAGQRLYVVRGNELAGMLTVMRPSQYTSECVVVASRQTAELPSDVKVNLVSLKPGDLVVRKTKYISGAGLMRDRVPRMVPVPYAAYDEETETLKAGSHEVKIPRDQVEQWKKDHPQVKTGGRILEGGASP